MLCSYKNDVILGFPPASPFIHRHQYNYDHQNGDHNTDVSDSVQAWNKVYSYIAT